MGAATGWPSALGWALYDITGGTEDWNYFAQGAYGYTPEARGPSFHANYAGMVAGEYVGDPLDQADGVREAFMLAGETAGDENHHSVISGTAPPGVTLRLRKQFSSPSHPDAPAIPRRRRRSTRSSRSAPRAPTSGASTRPAGPISTTVPAKTRRRRRGP